MRALQRVARTGRATAGRYLQRTSSSTSSSPSSATAVVSATAVDEAPTRRQLRILALRRCVSLHAHSSQMQRCLTSLLLTRTPSRPPTPPLSSLPSAVPMIGFGFMDNQIMLLMGDQIDSHLGVVLGLSTLAAAGIGQIFSDVAGISCGGAVDAGVSKLNLTHHHLTQRQLGMRTARFAVTGGGCVGVVIGCILGMSCLFWIDTTRADRLKRAEELTTIFRSVVADSHAVIDADRSALWMLDAEKGELWSRVMSETKRTIRLSSSEGIAGSVVKEKKAEAESKRKSKQWYVVHNEIPNLRRNQTTWQRKQNLPSRFKGLLWTSR